MRRLRNPQGMIGTNNGESVRVIDRARFRLTLFHCTSNPAAPRRM